MTEPSAADRAGPPRPSPKVVVVLLGVLGLLVVARLGTKGSDSGSQLVATSCAAPAVGLASTTVRHGSSITFEVTGPETSDYLAWIDAAASSTPAHGQPTATPSRPGADPELVLPPVRLTACRLTTTQGLTDDVAPGPHTLVVFRDEQGADPEVASVAFTVAQPSGR